MPGMTPEERRIRNKLSSQPTDAPQLTPSEIIGQRNAIKRQITQSISQTVDDDAVILRDGTVAFDAPQAGKTPTISTHLATKAYVDDAVASESVTSHTDLDDLDEDDHSQYVHNTIARTVSANHSFTGVPAFTNIDVNGGNITGITDLAVADGGTGQSTLDNLITLGNHTVGNYMVNTTGNSQIAVSHTQGEGSTAALSIVNDSIGDTQLAYNTGQHLTTSSNVQFGDIIVDGDDITSNPFTSGFTGGGWKIDNTAHAEFSSASIRGTLSVYELLLQQLRATNGSVLITAVAKVESIDGSDITFEDPSDNGVCPFHTNDIVMVQRADLTGTSGADNGGGTLNVIRRLVRRVTSVSGRTITVTRDGDLPADTGSFGVGDDVVRIGNTTNTNRDAVLYLSADDSKAPYLVIKDGVNSWANWGSASTEKARLGRLDGITDTDAGLSGSQSNVYGLYSDSVYLIGHIQANSGSIGGIKMTTNKLYAGTGDYYNSNTPFYLDGTTGATSGDFSLGNKLKWDSSEAALTVTGTINIGNPSDINTNAITNGAGFTDDTAADAAQVTANTGVANAATAQTAANSAQSTANGRNTSFYQDGIPTSLAAGDIWFDTNDDLKMYRARGAGDNEISGSEWVAVAGEGVGIGTLITGSGVYTGTLTAGQVNAVAIDAGSITAGTLTGRTVQTASSGNRMELDGVSNSLSLIEYKDSADRVRVLIDDDDTAPTTFGSVAEYASPAAWWSGTVGPNSNIGSETEAYSASRSLPAGRDVRYKATIYYTSYISQGDAGYYLTMQGSTDNSSWHDIYTKYVNDPASGAVTTVYFPTMGYTYHRIKGKFINDHTTQSTNYTVSIQETHIYDQKTVLNQGGCSWMGRYGWSRLGSPAVAASLSQKTHGKSVFESYGTADFWQVGSGGQNGTGNLMNFTLSANVSKAWTMYMESDGDLIIVNSAGKGMKVSYTSGGVTAVT